MLEDYQDFLLKHTLFRDALVTAGYGQLLVIVPQINLAVGDL